MQFELVSLEEFNAKLLKLLLHVFIELEIGLEKQV